LNAITVRQAAERMAGQLRKGDRLGCYIEDVGIAIIDFRHLDQHGENAFADGLETFVHEWFHHIGWTDRRIDRWWKKRAGPRRVLMQKLGTGRRP